MVIEGGTTGQVFTEYVREVLLPTLSVGDYVIADNLAAHKNAEAERLIRSAGANILFLPPYSPDMNPIEMMWSKVKAGLRRAKARPKEALEEALASALQSVTPSDAKSWFRECGYTVFQ